jgi:hypothetical protein
LPVCSIAPAGETMIAIAGIPCATMNAADVERIIEAGGG